MTKGEQKENFQHQFSLFLDQSLITAMKDEAQWMMRNNLTDEKQIPDFMQHLYLKGLKEVKSGAVTVIQ
jgi:NitT/TauT family transport system substrate-binding protein